MTTKDPAGARRRQAPQQLPQNCAGVANSNASRNFIAQVSAKPLLDELNDLASGIIEDLGGAISTTSSHADRFFGERPQAGADPATPQEHPGKIGHLIWQLKEIQHMQGRLADQLRRFNTL